jgi:hypothetical protein
MYEYIFSLQVMYAAFDSGNYFVIPGSPAEAFQAGGFIAKSNHQDVRISLGLASNDFLIAIVGSPFSYGGNLMEEALVLQAVSSLVQQYPSENSTQSYLKVRIFTGNITEKYRMAHEVMIHPSIFSFIMRITASVNYGL